MVPTRRYARLRNYKEGGKVDDQFIPSCIANDIVRQVFECMYETISNQAELTKSQLLQMMATYFNKAFNEYLDTLKKRFNEIDLDIDSH